MLCLVIDIGASNGRAMLGTIENCQFEIEEIHRFPNDPIIINGIFYWDILRLFHEIKVAISKTKTQKGMYPDSIGIDTWGASFALLDKDGDLLSNPMHYRNECVQEYVNEMDRIIDQESMFMKLGYYPTIVFNAYHLFYLKNKKPELLKNADHFINISDLFNYFLTGKIISEKTIAATSLLYNIKTSEWDFDTINKLGFDTKLFKHDLVEPGTIIGYIKKELCDELNIDKDITVIAVAGHDTTSAALTVPLKKGKSGFGYLSCGTWSVLGAEIDSVNPSKTMFHEGITYDVCMNSSKHIRKNINGLWILQECKKYWELHGDKFSYAQLEIMASESQPFLSVINVADPIFFSSGNMPEKINKYLTCTGQRIPGNIGEYCRIIIESLVLKYKEYVLKIENEIDYLLKEIIMFGGGIQNHLLCQFTSNALNRKVIAGPIEATVVGNLMLQGMALGRVKGQNEVRSFIENSSDIQVYYPNNSDKWEDQYNSYISKIYI